MKEREDLKKTSKQPTKSSWDDDAYFDFLQDRKKDALQAVAEMSNRPLKVLRLFWNSHTLKVYN